MDTAAAPLVALVEDDDDLRVATEQLLSLNGFAVRSFTRAPAALAAIGADFPGIVVTDVRMPGMSGIELFRALRERDADLPVVLMTGHGDVEMAVAALKAGAWDFLTKPFDAEILLAAVGRAWSARVLVLENRRLRALAEAKAALGGESARSPKQGSARTGVEYPRAARRGAACGAERRRGGGTRPAEPPRPIPQRSSR